MIILVVNPNISDSVTALIREEAVRAELPGAGITTAMLRSATQALGLTIPRPLLLHADEVIR